VVPTGALAAGIAELREVGLLRGSGVAAARGGLAPGVPVVALGVPAVALGVRVADVQVRRVPGLVAGVPATVRAAGKGVGRPVGGPTSLGVVRVAGRPGSGLIGLGGLPAAEKRRRSSGRGVRETRTERGVRGPGSGHTGRAGLRMAGDRQVSGGAGIRTRAREAAGRAMGVREGLGALGRTTMAARRIAAPRGHDGGLRGMRAG
jgi:hypothetical protein